MIPIVDISKWQDACDFKKMKTKVQGMIFRAGQGSKVDPLFDTFRKGAIAEGIVFGTYWYYNNTVAPKDQAKLWVETVKDNPGGLGAWLDLEDSQAGSYGKWTDWRDCAEEFKALLPAVTLGIYTRASYFDKPVGENYPYFATHPLWVAYYSTAPKPVLPKGWTDWVMWQYTDKGNGKDHGVRSDNIDMDWYNLDEVTFKQRFGNGGKPVTSDDKYRVTADPTLNVREAPGKTSAKKGSLKLNEVVEKIDQNEDGTWFQIRNADGTLTGWCSAEYLEAYQEGEHPNPIIIDPVEDITTTPSKGVTRIEGKRYGVRFYLTICKPADVTIKVFHEDSRPSVIAKREGAKFGFNGDDWQRNTRKVKGMEMSDGKLHQKRTHGEPSLIVTKDGRVFIDNKNITGQWNVSSGLRYLVKGGKNLIPPNGTELKYKEKHARSARGLHTDGRVMFLTVDGDYVRTGMTLWEMAELMLGFGCAVAFDGGGGGDSVDVVDGVIANIPDDEAADGTPVERRVPQTILVFTKN